MNKSIDFLKYELVFESIYTDEGGFLKTVNATQAPFSEALFRCALKWVWRAETTDKNLRNN